MSSRIVSRPAIAVIVLLALVSLVGCSHLIVLHDPLSASEHNDLGVVYESSGQLDLAANEYRRALKREPHHAQARLNLGNIEAARGQWRRAEKCYRRALADSSTYADAMNNLAIALLRQRRNLNEARALAQQAVNGGGAQDSLYRATLDEIHSASIAR